MIEVFRNLLCVAGGVALGYYLAHVRLSAGYIEKLEIRSEEYKQYYKKRYDDAFDTDVDAAVDAAVEQASKLEMARKVYDKQTEETPEPPKAEEKPALKTVPKPSEKKVNYNHISTPPKVVVEEAEETPAKSEQEEMEIESITQTDFMQNQFDYKQFSLSYWAGDDVLSNESDEPINHKDRKSSVGAPTLEKLKAGRSSMDGQEALYIRNRTGKWEFEITWSGQKFSEVIGPIPEGLISGQIDAVG